MMTLSTISIRTDFLTGPERMLFCGMIMFAVLSSIKMCVALLNGWTAFASNAILSLSLLLIVFGWEWSWNEFATYLCIVLLAAGIHGTVTKLSEYPHPRENPTPSGTPRQNYDKIV